MISEIWIFLRNGLSLWNHRFDETKPDHSYLDKELISGILTASSNFTQEALGGKLKDLIMENELLHQFPILGNQVTFAILVDKTVNITQLDKILLNMEKSLKVFFEQNSFEYQNLNDSEIELQFFFQKIPNSIFEKFIEDLNIFKEYQEKISGDSFDHSQINFLKKIPDIVPTLISNRISLIMRDITTKKTHLSQNYANYPPDLLDQIEKLIKSFEDLDLLFNESQLLRYNSFFILGQIGIAVFIIQKNLFALISAVEFDKVFKFEKLTKEIIKKLQEIH